MKIGIDISQIVYEGTGVAVYTTSLVEALLRLDKENEYVLFGSSLRKKTILKQFIKSLNAKNVNKKLFFLPPKILEFLWNGIHVFPVESLIGKVDVYHSSDWLEPPTRSAKRVTTIHDFAVFKYPETFSSRGGHDIVKNQKRKLHFVKRYSDKIIAVSQNTKQDAIDILGISKNKISVVYEAAEPVYSPRGEDDITRVKNKFKINGDYLLCVGTREPRKNLEKVIMAYKELVKAYPDLVLVIVGKYGWGEDNLKFKIENLKMKILGFVEKEDLAVLYSGATAFVYPSLYEGFGLPILEAMACGCPVITSKIGSMKEIAGEAALLVDPENINDIAGAISKVIRGEKVKEELKIKGLGRAGDFSWEKAALETLAIYQSLVSEK